MYIDDGSGVIAVVLPRHIDGVAGLQTGVALAWCPGNDNPKVGDVIDLFGTLHSGFHQVISIKS